MVSYGFETLSCLVKVNVSVSIHYFQKVFKCILKNKYHELWIINIIKFFGKENGQTNYDFLLQELNYFNEAF